MITDKVSDYCQSPSSYKKLLHDCKFFLQLCTFDICVLFLSFVFYFWLPVVQSAVCGLYTPQFVCVCLSMN